jgi:hypothetical protein
MGAVYSIRRKKEPLGREADSTLGHAASADARRLDEVGARADERLFRAARATQRRAARSESRQRVQIG